MGLGFEGIGAWGLGFTGLLSFWLAQLRPVNCQNVPNVPNMIVGNQDAASIHRSLQGLGLRYQFDST